MNWKFWKKPATDDSGGATGVKLDKPKDLPEAVGRKMVVDMKLDPDRVWSLKYVSRPLEGRLKTKAFRIYDPATVNQAGVVIKNWTTLDERPEFVIYSGLFEKASGRVEFHDA